jgi:exodeoxyribonuclease-3
MKIATWNINGMRARVESAAAWIKETQPDIVCLQELKCEDAAFPQDVFADLGYNIAVNGQKSFNGVALLSKLPLEDVSRGLTGDDGDTQARFIEGVVSAGGGAVRIVSLYLPNGNPPGSDRFLYKLAWIERLAGYASARLAEEEAFVLAGDFNIIPENADARFPDNWRRVALFQPESRVGYRRLINLGLTDAVRACEAGPGPFTFWDYQAGAWQKDNGIRIDHVLLSPRATDRLVSATVDKRTRQWDKPSDHVPVIVEIRD